MGTRFREHADMNTKPLYVLIDNMGDGSYLVRFTMNTDWIRQQEELDEKGELSWDSLGVDGDGFHYKVIQVPESCTYESLGIDDCVTKLFLA